MDRQQILAALISEEDRYNGEFAGGQIDRDTWAKSLQGLDERFSVIGLRMVNRPWENRNGSIL